MGIGNKQEQVRIKRELKRAVQDFWNMNPCAGPDHDYASRFEWLKKTERYAYEILNPDVVRDKLILEVGCGQGFMANYVARWAKHVTAIDISEESLNFAKLGSEELGVKNVNYHYGDAEDLSFPDNKFDLVYSLGVLHHTPNTQKGINELYRVLKPGGNVVVMLYKKHNPKWLAVVFFRVLSKFVDLIMHKEFYIADKLRESYIKKSYAFHGTALLELFWLSCFEDVFKRAAKTDV